MPTAYDLAITQLYKYRPLSEGQRQYTHRVITHNELMFASPKSFNDPFEARPQVRISGTRKEIEIFLAEMVKNLNHGETPAERLRERKKVERTFRKDPHTNFQQTLWEILNDYGVLSLSADPVQPLMWSHYADSHQGVCFEFDAREYFFQYARQVSYQSEYPLVDPRTQSALVINETAIVTKAKFWEYEQEFRVIFPKMSDEEKQRQIAGLTTNELGKHLVTLHNGPGVVTFPPKALTGVILGARVSQRDEAEIVGLVRGLRPDVRVERAMLHNSSYRLERVAL